MILQDNALLSAAKSTRPEPPDPVQRAREKLAKLLATASVGDVWKAHFPDTPLPDYLRSVGDGRFSEVIRPYVFDFLEDAIRDTLAEDLPEAIETILGGRR